MKEKLKAAMYKVEHAQELVSEAESALDGIELFADERTGLRSLCDTLKAQWHKLDSHRVDIERERDGR